MRRMILAVLTTVALVALAFPTPGGAAHTNIVASVSKAPIDPDGDVAGARTDLVLNLDRSLDPSVEGRALLAGDTIKITLPDDFEYLGGDLLNPGPPPNCPPPAGSCGTGVLLQGWPQNPIPPVPDNYTLSLEGTHTVVFTATRDLVPGDLSLNGPGIKQIHLILTNFVNPHAGHYEFEVAAETGTEGALETGTAEVRIRPKPHASINVTSVFAGPPPFANTIYQSTDISTPAPYDWNFLVWDKRGEPAVGLTVEQVNPRRAHIKDGNRVVGQVRITAPAGASGQEISGGPSVLVNAPVKNIPAGRLTVQFTAGDSPGVYTATLVMNGGAPVTMYVTAS